ncbi:MAG: hypothetical protein V3S31_03320 [Dehalococcoidia bacterium]
MSSALAVSLAIAVPLLLVAAALGLNAYLVLRRPRAAAAPGSLDALATESMDQLLLELQRSVGEIKGQLAGQRATLAGLLSGDPAPVLISPQLQAVAPVVPQGSSPPAEPQMAPAAAARPAASELQASIARLVAEGLSDRAIARRLSIGMEEVRLARLSPGRAS